MLRVYFPIALNAGQAWRIETFGVCYSRRVIIATRFQCLSGCGEFEIARA